MRLTKESYCNLKLKCPDTGQHTVASDISDGLQDVKKARSNKKRAAFTAFKSLAFGKNVKKAKVKKSLSKIVNIDEKSIRKAIQRRQKVLKGDLPSWQYTK